MKLDREQLSTVLKDLFGVGLNQKDDPYYSATPYGNSSWSFRLSAVEAVKLELTAHVVSEYSGTPVKFISTVHPFNFEDRDQTHYVCLYNDSEHCCHTINFRFCKASDDSNYAAFVAGRLETNQTAAEIYSHLEDVDILNDRKLKH
jgi:hypothetical protein